MKKFYQINRNAFFHVISVAFLILWLALSINVQDRKAWWLENLLIFASVVPIIHLYFKKKISKLSLLLVFVFFTFHTIGAHYTYSLVPYNEWTKVLFGHSLNSLLGWNRNHYDRLVHFLCGFLLYVPVYELVRLKTKLSARRVAFFAVLIILAASTMYELLEWTAAWVFGGDVGQAYIGTQGDEWDSQKDEALALSGAIIASFLFRLFKSPHH